MGFRADERSQSVQIGAVLLFGTLVVVFAIYQSAIVPNQNRGVEFNHNQRVRADMVEVRNTILETKASGADGYATVELGTEYPPRLIAVNPPAPSGRLATTELREITVAERAPGADTDVTTDVCPGTDVRTRFLQYTPQYAEFEDPGTLRYENSLVYNDFGSGAVRLTGQDLVEGGVVQITTLRASVARTGSSIVAVEPKAGGLRTSTRTDVNVTLPTRLSETAWEEALSGEVDAENVTVTEGAAGRNLTLALNGEIEINCGPVGLGRTPSDAAGGARGGTADEINPAAPGDISLLNEGTSGSVVDLTFNNTGGTNNFTAGRINFYEGQGQVPTEADVIAPDGTVVATNVQIGAGFQDFNPDAEIAGETTSVVQLDFDNNVNPNDWFIVTFRLETGETGLYFVRGG